MVIIKRPMSYRVKNTAQYRRDIKRLKKAGYDLRKIDHVVHNLAARKVLPTKHKDHSLKGILVGHRECHIEGDWLLMYRYEQDELVLVLVRSGTHSQLFN